MKEIVKKCPYCGNILDEKSVLYKGYYVCSSCANTINDSKNVELIRRFSNYIRNLEFQRADSLRKEMLDDADFDVNELQLFTFYSAILHLFLTRDPSNIIKFLNDSTATDIGVVIEVLNFLTSISVYVEKLGKYIHDYVDMQEKYLSQLNNYEFNVAYIELKKKYFKSILNKSSFIMQSYKQGKMSLQEILELIHKEDPGNIAALYAIFDDVATNSHPVELINSYLKTCDYALELYYEKSKRKMSDNYKVYYKKSLALRRKYNLHANKNYLWQKKLTNNLFWGVIIIIMIIIGIMLLK
jgi:hypothetical protein